MEVTIRDADPEDETGLRILRGQALKAAFQDEYDRKTVGDLVATVDDDLSAWIDNDRSRVLVAETEITPVSYGVLDREHGELLSILTSPDYQREGFATQLLDRLETHAREHDVETLTATAEETHLAGSTAEYEVEITDEGGDRIATFRGRVYRPE